MGDNTTDLSIKTVSERRQFHVFISYHHSEPDDLEFVTTLRRNLHSKGYRIFVPQEEFELNITLQENIEKAIDLSFKTIIVVSDVYLNSHGCKQELGVIFKRFHDNSVPYAGNPFIIPLIRGCIDSLPDEIRHLQCIDCKRLGWYEKVYKLLRRNDESMLLDNPTLSQGKKYDVFFSYKTVSPDKEWVRQVVDSLEKSDDKIACAYHERDFQTGRPVLDNIKYFIENSNKIVIALSTQYLSSEWTKYETEIAQFRSIRLPHDLVVVPVVLARCDIPDRLSNITYLDATDDESVWWNKLLQTINCPSK